jgi:hypothetical protein
MNLKKGLTQGVCGVCGAIALVGITVTSVLAEEGFPLGVPISELYNRYTLGRSGEFYQSRSLLQQLDVMLGVDLFPENRIMQDARYLHVFHTDVFNQQTISDPTIRTLDADNPFNEVLE